MSLKITMKPVTDLKPNARNTRVHTKSQIDRLAQGIRDFGFNNPILIDKDGVILAGHARWEAAQAAELDKVPTIQLAHLTPEQARAYMIADNRLADMSEFDDTLLRQELAELSEIMDTKDLSSLGFSEEEVEALLEGWNSDIGDKEPGGGEPGPPENCVKLFCRPEDHSALTDYLGDVMEACPVEFRIE